MAIRERGNGFQADVTWKGKRARESFTTRKDAEAWEGKALDALRKGKELPKVDKALVKSNTIEELLRTVIATEWKSANNRSADNAWKFVRFVGPNTSVPEALTQQNIDAWVIELYTTNVMGSTINRHLSAVSKLMKRALSRGDIPRPLVLPWRKEGTGRTRYYSEEEERAIIQTLQAWSQPKLADWFITLVDTGLRTWSEAGGLAWKDIDLQQRKITVYAPKTNTTRIVPLTIRAAEAIARQDRTLKGPFTDITSTKAQPLYNKLKECLPQLEDTVWYTARHTFASRLVQRCVRLEVIQKLMGHSNIMMTMRYAKLASEQLVEAIGVLEPGAVKLRVVS